MAAHVYKLVFPDGRVVGDLETSVLDWKPNDIVDAGDSHYRIEHVLGRGVLAAEDLGRYRAWFVVSSA